MTIKNINIPALFLCGIFMAYSVHAQDTLIDASSIAWKYLDDGSDQGSAWKAENFDDSTWDNTGAITNDISPRETTTYFRHQFTITEADDYTNLVLMFLRDDGAIAYINGAEVGRNHLPPVEENVAFDTAATTEVNSDTVYKPIVFLPPASMLHDGVNTLAVEIHQFSPESSDLTFALQLLGNPVYTPQVFNRGPYLQMITPESAIIRWDTIEETESVVHFGLDPNNLSDTESDDTETHFHEILLEDLDSASTYYYSIGPSESEVLASGADYFFKTQPAPESTTPTRIWIIGDSGTGDQNQQAVYEGYQQYTAATYTDLWLMLGDNAYTYGTDLEYQTSFFEMYPQLLKQTVVWPSLGNHDGYSVNTTFGTGPYYHAFTLPKAGEAGGIPSGTEAYYSYDYGNIHFIALDSFDVDRSANADMAQWLEEDLDDTDADWIIAYWHHPPYSNGTHHSDIGDGYDNSSTGIDSHNAMQEMRSNILPILEERGVDLVLTGHSHTYERSKFIQGHYGPSTTYCEVLALPGCPAAHALNTGSGDNHNGAAVYSKSHPAVSRGGTVYTVAGTSGGASGAGPFPMMYRTVNQAGSMVIDVDNLALTARFINRHGVVFDAFTIQKLREPPDPDRDGDNIPDASDNCPLNANANQQNEDADTNGDLCDTDWLDNDTDGFSNSSDWDDDGDGVPDVIDAEPLNGNNRVEVPLPLDGNYKGSRLKDTSTRSP